MNEFSVLKKAVMTERSTMLKSKWNQYVFQVDKKANKNEIRSAVEKLFKVSVLAVRTANFPGKLRRLAMGRPQGRRTAWKKAIVTLKPGQEIKLEPETPK